MTKFLLIVFCLSFSVSIQAQDSSEDALQSISSNEQFIGQFSQLAPMAINPYATVFVTAICSKMDLHNDYVKTNSFFNNWFILGLFGLLFGYTAIIGTLFKVGPMSPMGIADNWLSGKAALLIQGIIVITPTFLSSNPELDSTVITAGFVTMSLKTILVLAISLYYLIVVMTVNFFIDILVFLSPIPLVDAVLNISKIVFAVALVIISIYSPMTTVIIAALIFLFSLLLYKRAKRLVNKTKYLIVYPILNVFRSKQTVLTDGKHLSILALTHIKLGKIKKGRIVRLETRQGKFVIVKNRFILSSIVQEIDLSDCFLSQTHLDIHLTNEKANPSLILNRSYHKCIDELAELLNVPVEKRATFNLNIKLGLLGKLKGMFNKSDIEELKSV